MYRIYREFELHLRIKSCHRLVQSKQDKLVVLESSCQM